MSKRKDLLIKETGGIIAALFCLVMGVYKAFFQMENRVWSLIFGIILIIGASFYLFVTIRTMLKSK